MTDIQFSSWGEQIVDNRGKKAKDFKPIENVSLPEEFKQNETIKALIGWYGIITRSDEVNMVDLCRSYMTAVHNHSCGLQNTHTIKKHIRKKVICQSPEIRGQKPEITPTFPVPSRKGQS